MIASTTIDQKREEILRIAERYGARNIRVLDRSRAVMAMQHPISICWFAVIPIVPSLITVGLSKICAIYSA